MPKREFLLKICKILWKVKANQMKCKTTTQSKVVEKFVESLLDCAIPTCYTYTQEKKKDTAKSQAILSARLKRNDFAVTMFQSRRGSSISTSGPILPFLFPPFVQEEIDVAFIASLVSLPPLKRPFDLVRDEKLKEKVDIIDSVIFL